MTDCGFGIDIGGSGIKAARVDLTSGEFIGEREKILTPQPATPEAVAEVVATLVDHADWTGSVGITLPSVIVGQRALTAANIDSSWLGLDAGALFTHALGGRPVHLLNDADAAGIAEVTYGLDDADVGTVLLLTFGTGIGSALFRDGVLVPNTELGHMHVAGLKEIEAEQYASSRVKTEEKLSYKAWAKRVSRVLNEYSRLLRPQLFVVGGGISRKAEKWVPRLTVDVPVVAAVLENRAGIVGAALAADRHLLP
ncbi:MAG: ROK family protein [Corynebacterium sp.]|nr:ROK family protein [Corynebacterium sp.]